jgi:hypothetical protein
VSKEFKVGDEVTAPGQPMGSVWAGVMTIDSVYDDGDFCCVSADGRYGVFEPSELKHLEATPVPKEFRFFRRSDSSISEVPYSTFEAALAGWKTFAQDGQEVEIIEVVSHGTYKAVLKVEEA